MRLGPGDQNKINAVLTDFSRICMSAILNSPVNVSPSWKFGCTWLEILALQLESVIEGADATENEAVADFLRQTLSGSMVRYRQLKHVCNLLLFCRLIKN